MTSDYTIVTRVEDLGRVAQRVAGATVLGLDIETYDPIKGGGSLDPLTGEIRLVQFNIDDEPDGLFVIDLMQTGSLGPVEQALRDTKAVVVAHNAKFEQKWFLHKYGIRFWPIFCTFRASWLLHNGRKLGHGLWDLYSRELKIREFPADQATSDWSRPNLSQEQLDYAVEDVVHLPKLRTILKEKLAKWGLLFTALIEFGAILAEGEIELNGFPFDSERWLLLAEENRVKAHAMGEDLLVKLPHPKGQLALPGMTAGWNLNSTTQMLGSLRKLGIDVEATNAIALTMVAGKYPVVEEILAHRSVVKQVSSFGPEYLKYIHSLTGRIHTSFYALLDTGRYSSSKPNLQQIPADPRFRECFRAPPGKRFVAADYSGIEMRIVAEISGDAALTRVFENGEDAHYATAAIIRGKPLSEVTKAERQFAKPVNFGLIYGMMPPKLVQYAMSGYGVAMTERQATTYHKRYFDRYSGIRRWHDRVARDGKREGISRTLSGRLRWLDPQKAWNEFKNTPVQGCLPATCRVLTDSGYVPIAEAEGQVWTGTEWAAFDRVSKGRWQSASIELGNGQVLQCDTRHKVLVEGEDGYCFSAFSELEGKRVCLSLAQSQEWGASGTVADETAYWIGFAIGKGCTCNGKNVNALAMTFGDRKGRYTKELQADRFTAWVLSQGWVTQAPRVSDNKITIVVQQRSLREKWQAQGYCWGDTAKLKRVPTAVWRMSLALRVAFLVGLLDADGTIGSEKSPPNLHMSSLGLLEEVQVLLRGVGVETKLRRRFASGAYRLDLNGDQAHRQLAYGEPRLKNTVRMPAPRFLVARLLALVTGTPPLGLTRADCAALRRLRAGGTTSVYNLRRMAQRFGVDLGEVYAAYDVVAAVVGEEEIDTWTLAVHNPQHRFDSEGVISKNTGADALKLSLRGISDRLVAHAPAMKIVHIIHDEVILEVDDDDTVAAKAKSILQEEMTKGMQRFLKKVPVVVDPAEGYSWAESH